MEEELRKAFSKKEKIENFISKLDKLKQEGSIAEAQYLDLRAEYELLLEETIVSIKEIKSKTRKEFNKKAGELEELQKEHDLWQARLNVGEIRAASYWAQIRPVKKAIDQLKKEVPRLRVQANATSSAEIGGPLRVEIPELKIKKVRKKPGVVASPTGNTEEQNAGTDTDGIGEDTSSATAHEGQLTAKYKTSAPESPRKPVDGAVKRSHSASPAAPVTRGVIDERQHQGPGEGALNGKMVRLVIGGAIVIVVLIFVIGRIVSSSADRNPPIISGFTISEVSGSSATIEWATNENATSQVFLRDPAGAVISTQPDKSLVTKHSTKVSGIKPNVKYQITIKSADASGNEFEYKTEQAFTAMASTSPFQTAVSDVSILDISDTGAVITWKTDKTVVGQVALTEPGSKVPVLSPPKKDLTMNHAIVLSNLKPGVTYTFTLLFKDATGIETTYDPGKSFTTLASLPTGPDIGKIAPDFTLPALDGNNLKLSSFRGKVVLLNFFRRSCPACVREMPMIQSVFAKMPADQVIMLGVNVFEDEATVKDFKERWSLTFPILLDPKGQVSETYNVSDIPVTFFINRQGVIKEIKAGTFDSAEEIESILNPLLKPPISK